MTLGAWEICSEKTLIVKRSAKVMFPVLLAKDCNPQRHWQQIWRFCPQIPSEFQQIVEGSLLGEISSRFTSLQVHHFPIFQCFENHTVTSSGPWIHPLTLWLNCQPKAKAFAKATNAFKLHDSQIAKLQTTCQWCRHIIPVLGTTRDWECLSK